MGGVFSCIADALRAIGRVIMSIINAIGTFIMAIINGVIAFIGIIVNFLTCGYCGGHHRRSHAHGTRSRI